MNILSFGAGIQSSALYIMSALGRVPRYDAIIFADTGSETSNTYKWIDNLVAIFGLPVTRVRRKVFLAESALKIRNSKITGKDYISTAIPAFVGKSGMMRRDCTSEFKVKPIQAEIARLSGERLIKNRAPVDLSLGISTDEASRMKDSKLTYITHKFPLIELNYSRLDCKNYIAKFGLVAPRSACYFCPFHSDQYWSDLKHFQPFEFQKAVLFERQLAIQGKKVGLDLNIHRSRKSLDSINFNSCDTKTGFQNDCTGSCGG